jgi:superfamily II DNA or RNA helicase
MSLTTGHIYLRSHPSYVIYDAYKLGKALNIPERDVTYATGEIIRGVFELVIEIPLGQMAIVERLLQNEFFELNIKFDAGTEFYNKKIINLIEPYLNSMGITYRKLTKEEINNLVRSNRVRKTINKIKIKSLIRALKTKRTNRQVSDFTPRSDQIDIIEKAYNHFQENDKGMLILTCGVGKTLISLWTAMRLQLNTIVIGVPNKLLLKQWEEVICLLFQSMPYLVVCGGVHNDSICKFLENNRQKWIIITTYSSSHKINTAFNSVGHKASIKILDEAHHLTSYNMDASNNTKKYVQMLNIPSDKQLALTATIKQLESDNEMTVSNDNVKYFGEIIDKKSLLWAIENGIVCDYSIQTIITNETQLADHFERFNITEETEQRLFLATYAALKSISDGHSNHMLIYTNNKQNSAKVINYIRLFLTNDYFIMPELYYSNYHSDMSLRDQTEIISRFQSASYGIIPCVYCLGEGWDFPLLDAVVFAENMSSIIRIVQSALRASRKNKMNHNKKTKIILPILSRDDWLENNDNQDLKKVREVTYQMGLEDETISQKIKVLRLNIEKQIPKQREQKELLGEFGEYDDELTQKLRLKTVKRAALSITYDKAKQIISDKKITNKEEYHSLCDRDNRLSKEPEIVFKGRFTNWIDYLGIERVYYELADCKNKIGHYLTAHPSIKKDYLDLTSVNEKLCKLDPLFPPNGLWVEYYNVNDLRDIIVITNKKKKAGAVL